MLMPAASRHLDTSIDVKEERLLCRGNLQLYQLKGLAETGRPIMLGSKLNDMPR
jgi:hypothetical protein